MSDVTDRTVVEILEARIDVLSALRDLTRRRHEAVEAGRADAVRRLVEARRPLIDRLLADAGGLEAAASDAASSAAGPDSHAIELVDRASSLLEEIESLDREDDAALRRGGESTRNELDDLTRTARAGRAYRQASGPAGTRLGREQSA